METNDAQENEKQVESIYNFALCYSFNTNCSSDPDEYLHFAVLTPECKGIRSQLKEMVNADTKAKCKRHFDSNTNIQGIVVCRPCASGYTV